MVANVGLLHQEPAAGIQMPQNSPAELDLFRQSAINFRDTILRGIDQQVPTHSGQHLLNVRRRIVVGIRPEVQADEFVSRRTYSLASGFSAIPLIQEGIWQRLEYAFGMLRVFFFLLFLLAQLLRA